MLLIMKILHIVKISQLLAIKKCQFIQKRSLKLGQEGVVYLKILISESGVSEQIEFLKNLNIHY